MAPLDHIWRRMSPRDRVAMMTDHMALRVRGRQNSKRWMTDRLSQQRSPRAVFARFDANRDGRLTLPEFRTAMRREFQLTGPAVTELFRQWDTDGSGTLEYAKLATGIHRSTRHAANRVAHAVDVVTKGQSDDVDRVRTDFLASVARGNQDVSPQERRMARAILGGRRRSRTRSRRRSRRGSRRRSRRRR